MSQTNQPATISHAICEPDDRDIPPHPAAQRLAASLMDNASRISRIQHWAEDGPARAATLRITAAGKRVFAKAISHENADAVLDEGAAGP